MISMTGAEADWSGAVIAGVETGAAGMRCLGTVAARSGGDPVAAVPAEPAGPADDPTRRAV
ncbi:hypothetical protein Plo01_09530 [Planobispora longispora]|uniref:Uncharacterized protein n=1 Tax=Planobispora longispora TaxID=28887 RepID=A0A8J3W2N1_9ACTN|nr:hypothetical protein Plo01_09530 [Planobispora longispora]